jgi:hypothetical protein
MAAVSLVVMGFISSVLRVFIALKSPPAIRAAWTAASSLLIMTLITFVFDGFGNAFEEYELLFALTTTFCSLLVFAYWWYVFKRAWIADPDGLPHGVRLENDDWRLGLLMVIFAGAIVWIKVLLQ